MGNTCTRLIVRRYVAADLASICAISEQAPQAAQWSPAGYEEAVRAGQLVLVAEVDEAVSGFAVCRFVASEGEILNVAVVPELRRKDIGNKLLAAIMQEARAKSVERMFLEVRESNSAAIAFYKTHGFATSGRRTKYYDGPTENAVMMEKKLTG